MNAIDEIRMGVRMSTDTRTLDLTVEMGVVITDTQLSALTNIWVEKYVVGDAPGYTWAVMMSFRGYDTLIGQGYRDMSDANAELAEIKGKIAAFQGNPSG